MKAALLINDTSKQKCCSTKNVVLLETVSVFWGNISEKVQIVFTLLAVMICSAIELNTVSIMT